MSNIVPLDLLKKLAPIALDLAKSQAGDNPLVGQIISAASTLLSLHPDPAAQPVKQELDAGVKDALEALHQSGEDARSAVRFRPPGQG